MGVFGADVAQLRTAAGDVERAADGLESISSVLSGELSRTPWRGADADSFRSLWTSDYARKIAAAVTLLRDTSRVLQANADAQEVTSATDGGGPGGAGGQGGGGSGSGLPTPPVADVPSRDPNDPIITVGGATESDATSAGARWGLSAQFDQSWEVAGATVEREGDYGVGAKAEVEGYFDIGAEDKEEWERERDLVDERRGDKIEDSTTLVEAGGRASAQVGAWAEDSIGISGAHAGVHAGYDAMAGARAEAAAGISLGNEGLQAGASAGAFAGAEITGEVGGEVAGVGGNIEAGLRAGIGADASADVRFGLDRVEIELELGVALGVGFSIKPSISFSPQEFADTVGDIFGF